MTNKRYTEIPKRQKCIDKEEPYIGGAEDIIDEITYPNNPRKQSEINTMLDTDLYASSTGLKDRMTALEEAGSITIEGIERGIANNPEDIQPGSGKIPTANAVGGLMNLIANTTWALVIVDAKQKVLGGITKEGNIEWKKGVPTPIKNYIENRLYDSAAGEYISNDKWSFALTDNTNKIIAGVRPNGSVYIQGEIGERFIVDKSIATEDLKDGYIYNSLAKCIYENRNREGVHITLRPGTYDLIAEIKELFDDDDYFKNYSKTDTRHYGKWDYGLPLRNGIVIEGHPNALITCNYEGDVINGETVYNENVCRDFSPFNNDRLKGFTLRGVHLECKNVRYAIHDDPGVAKEPYVNIYDKCSIIIDNTSNPYWGSKAVIGGGLGLNGIISITNCYFKSVGVSNQVIVSYHNSGFTTWHPGESDQTELSEGGQSFIICSGNYIEGTNGFGFFWLGASELITKILCNNNSFGKPIIFAVESGGAKDYHAYTVYEDGMVEPNELSLVPSDQHVSTTSLADLPHNRAFRDLDDYIEDAEHVKHYKIKYVEHIERTDGTYDILHEIHQNMVIYEWGNEDRTNDFATDSDILNLFNN